MIPRRIAGATRYLGAPRGWEPEKDGDCAHLAILDTDGVMISAWEPTPKELEAMQSGAPVYLQVVGTAHPPVMVWVDTKARTALGELEDDLANKNDAPVNAEIARLRDALREIDGIIKRPQMSCGDRTAEIGRITSTALGERE